MEVNGVQATAETTDSEEATLTDVPAETTEETTDETTVSEDDTDVVEDEDTDEDTSSEDEVDEDEEVEVDDTELVGRLSPEDYEYVKELREEAKEKRLELKPFKEAFEGFEPEDVSAFLGAARALTENPRDAYEAFSGLTAALADALGIEAEDTEEGTTSGEDDDDRPLTKKEVAALLAETKQKEESEKAEADRKKAEEDAIADINKEVTDLGYSSDTTDPKQAIEYVSLLHLAAESTGGNLAEADKLLKEYKQSIIDAALAGEAKKAEDFPPQTSGTGGSGSDSRPKVKSVNEAAKLAKKRLDTTYSESESE